MNVINVGFPKDQYYPQRTVKKQVCLHHTVSPNHSPLGDINWWKQTAARVGTPGIITFNGDYYRLFSSKYWIHHLGVKSKFLRENMATKTNTQLNKMSIGIEIDSAGGLIEVAGLYYPVWNFIGDPRDKQLCALKYRTPIDDYHIQHYENGYRGYEAFQKYTCEQIETLKDLLLSWNMYYGIPIEYNPSMWDIDINALNGVPGVYSHTSYRSDKSDCHPQPELIEMLQSLKSA